MHSRIDHVVIGAANLISGTSILENKLNTKFSPGGEHQVMGTHNKLLKLQSNMYLEVIAHNPDADIPSRPRWFSLDESNIKEKIKNSPRALCWVLEVDNLEDTVVFSQRTAESFSKNIGKILLDSQNALELSEKSLKKSKEFDSVVIEEREAQIYEELISEKI